MDTNHFTYRPSLACRYGFRYLSGVKWPPKRAQIEMADQKQTETATAETQKLPAVSPGVAPPAREDDGQFRAEQERITKMIANDAPLNEILSNLVLMIEAQSPEMLCSILLISDDGNHVKHAVAPSLPENYIKVIDGKPIGPKHGSCGTAMYRGEPVIVSDISTDPLWDEYRHFAWAIDVAACWSTPIMSRKGKVLGSFAMYYREPRPPKVEERHLTEVATKLAALAIEHHASREHPASGQTTAGT
jgi:signal transduction protein with GAF and PtsI domain